MGRTKLLCSPSHCIGDDAKTCHCLSWLFFLLLLFKNDDSLWQEKRIIHMDFQLLNSVEHQQLIREEDNNKGSVFTLCLEHIMPHYRFLSLPSPTISHCRATSFKSVVFALKCLDRQVKEKNVESCLTESLTTPKIMFTFPVCVSSRQLQQTVKKCKKQSSACLLTKTHLPCLKYIMCF